jgi:ATP:ADP antiporter, AAA family
MSDSAQTKSPLRAVMDVRRGELPLAILMFSYFFLVITTFWILKPIKKALFIQHYDQQGIHLVGSHLSAAQGELIAKVLNMFVAGGAMIAFTWLSRKLVREKLSFAFSTFFAAGFVIYALLIAAPSDMTVWTFYLYGDLYSTVMVATFFAFLNDSVTPSAARRLYGLIVLGGVAGGVFGASAVAAWIEQLTPRVAMFVCLGVTAVVVVIAWGAGRYVRSGKSEAIRSEDDAPEAPASEKSSSNVALEGARLVFRSRYLLAIATILGVYEIVSTVLDFQFTSTVAHYLNGPDIGKQFSRVYTITNITSLVVQLLLTAFVMSRFRLTVALLITPLAILGSSGMFLALPLLWPGSLLNTADNALNYSINQSAREALYTPTTRDEKYKAKAFIDMFVQRAAKAVAVGVSLGITLAFTSFESVRWLSLFVALLVVVWALAARYAGRRFHELAEGAPRSRPMGERARPARGLLHAEGASKS